MITTGRPAHEPGKKNVPLTRRTTLLAGVALGGAALLTGCSDDSGPDRAEHTLAADRLRERAARDSAGLLARYDATLAAHPGLGERLRPLRAEVARHGGAFTGASPSAAPPSPAAERTKGAAGAPPVPEDEKTARASLADAERRLADARTGTLAEAPPELARLLASVAAAGAAHAFLLGEDH
jgi:hypothetical protein